MTSSLEFLHDFATTHRTLGFLLLLTGRVTVVLLLGWGTCLLMRKSSAAVRHRIWVLTIVATLILPLASAILPHLPITILERESAFDTEMPLLAVDTRPEDAWWLEWIPGAWALGASLGLLYVLAGTLTAARLVRCSRPVTNTVWLAELDELRVRAGVRRPIGLRERPGVLSSPCVWGAWRPQIVLSAGNDRWSAARRHRVLLHELAHIRRSDWLWQLAARGACAIWWFHPLCWVAARQLRSTGELAADDFVLAAGQPPASYAEELLNLAAELNDSPAWITAPSMARRSQLAERLAAILATDRPRAELSRTQSRVAIGCAAAMLATVASLQPAVTRAYAPPAPAATAQAETTTTTEVATEHADVADSDEQSPAAGKTPETSVQVTGHADAGSDLLKWKNLRKLATQRHGEGRMDEATRLLRLRELADRKLLQAPAVSPPGKHLLPNWDTSQNAARRLPNYEDGMARVYPLDPGRPIDPSSVVVAQVIPISPSLPELPISYSTRPSLGGYRESGSPGGAVPTSSLLPPASPIGTSSVAPRSTAIPAPPAP